MRASGQLLSASLLDYAMPRADGLPLFRTEISEVPSTTNPLGMRGGSEGGITPGLGAVANAIVDALAEFGVEHSNCRRRRRASGGPSLRQAPASIDRHCGAAHILVQPGRQQ